MARILNEQLHFAPVTELAEAIRAKHVSSLEVVRACLRRIAEVNPTINAVVRLADDAEDRARTADAALAAGAEHGPLHGVPFTIKDSLDTAGLVTTAGTTGWAGRVPGRDATVVARLKAAGGILLGKTNTPEFTWSDETDNLVYGRTNNPYDPERTPGGSSGGPGAIVAAGGSPFDIGSDTGDSIRQPSHVCGIAGIKPTSGRVPRTGHTPSFRGILESLTQL
jgi:amidase